MGKSHEIAAYERPGVLPGVLAAALWGLAASLALAIPAHADLLQLSLKSRDPTTAEPVLTPTAIDPAKTLVVVIDMWDRHWCKTYTARVANMIPRMNATLESARKLGIRVVMAPSDVADFYAGTPQREAMLAIPSHEAPPEVAFDPPPEPIGKDFCECGPTRLPSAGVWTRQHADLVIAREDFLADTNNGRELMNLCSELGVDTLIYCGVASNMCVCHRDSGMFNMRRHGLRTIFIRDLVESITANGVNPATSAPDPTFTPARGSHRTETYLEQHVSPSIESRQLISAAGQGDADARPHAVFVIADDEYETHRTLPVFARAALEPGVRCTFVEADSADRNDIPGLEALYEADVLVLSARRRFLPVPQMDFLERYLRSGKPVVAIRHSAAPFAVGAGLAPTAEVGQVVWQNFDEEVLGCHYDGYDAVARNKGSDVWAETSAAHHPLLDGLADASFHTPAWIYRVTPLASDATIVLAGKWSDDLPSQPVAWTRPREQGPMFYTSLGHPADFENPAFTRLLQNAILAAVDQNRLAAKVEATPE